MLTEVDELLELSVVPFPANDRTATLAAKGDGDQPDEPPSHAQLEVELLRQGIISRPAGLDRCWRSSARARRRRSRRPARRQGRSG